MLILLLLVVDVGVDDDGIGLGALTEVEVGVGANDGVKVVGIWVDVLQTGFDTVFEGAIILERGICAGRTVVDPIDINYICGLTDLPSD